MGVFVFIKKNIFSIIFLMFVVLLIIYSNSSFSAAKSGINLWANNVVPSLFPFLVAVELLKSTNIIYHLSIHLNKYMNPLFNLPGICSFPFIMGFLSGYPVGAKIVSDLYEKNAFSKDEAERMLPFVNNSGPLFIIGTVGISFYANSTIGIILLLTHIFSAITVGIIFGITSRFKVKLYSSNSNYLANHNQSISVYELGEILGASIMSSIKTILLIGGFVTLFSVIVSLIEKSRMLILVSNLLGNAFNINSAIISSSITGIIEFTNGLSKISAIHLKNISLNIIISSFIIGFGGISVLLQVLSIIAKQKLSINKYIIGKLLQAFISAFYTFLILQIPILNFDL